MPSSEARCAAIQMSPYRSWRCGGLQVESARQRWRACSRDHDSGRAFWEPPFLIEEVFVAFGAVRVKNRQMPLSPALMQCALQLIGDRGTPPKREPLGTAFCVVVPSERISDVLHGYIVTTHHVVADQDWERIDVRVPDPERGGELRLPTLVSGWRQPIPGLDLAMAPFPPAGEGLIPAVALGRHLLELRPNLPMIGMPFYYVGLFARLDRMMVRSGTIGAVDQRNIDHDPDYDYEYTAHLVDCRSYGGFSGSPCFWSYRTPVSRPCRPRLFRRIRPTRSSGECNTCTCCAACSPSTSTTPPIR